jgi:hypothetical protein
MPASNITSVTLNRGGSVTIRGEFTDIGKFDVALLHVWFVGTGEDGQDGVGLAIDCLETGQRGVSFRRPRFTLTRVLGAARKGAPGVKFGEGPAIASAIAVLTPKPPNREKLPAEVIQWSRTLSLETGKPR